jgi:hypothetical protein
MTGHETGVFVQPLNELWERYGEVIAEREEKLLKFLEKPATLEAIVESWIIYGKPRNPKEFFAFGERAHMIKHLEDLQKRGMVVKENDLYLKNSLSSDSRE